MNQSANHPTAPRMRGLYHVPGWTSRRVSPASARFATALYKVILPTESATAWASTTPGPRGIRRLDFPEAGAFGKSSAGWRRLIGLDY